VFEAAAWEKINVYDKIMIKNQKKNMEIKEIFTKMSI